MQINYEQAAKKYKPDKIKLLFIAESPPFAKEGEESRYFYFENVASKDFLLKNILRVLFSEDYENEKKAYWLNKLREKSIFLIDACEYPINQYNRKKRNECITNYIPNLVRRIKNLIDKDIQIILIKKNIFSILFAKLRSEEMDVINTEMLDFPSHGHQAKFREKLRTLLINNGFLN